MTYDTNLLACLTEKLGFLFNDQVLFVTCNINDYDDVEDKEFKYPTIFVTDSSNKKIIKTPLNNVHFFPVDNFSSLPGKLQSRWIKTIFFSHIAKLTQVVVYHDFNVEIKANVFSNFNDGIFLCKHPKNSSPQEELSACINSGKLSLMDLPRIIQFKKAVNKVDSFFECNIICVKNTEILAPFTSWFEFYMKGIKRDQLYFNAAMSEHNLKVNLMKLGDIRDKSNPNVKYTNHYECLSFIRRIERKILKSLFK